MERKCEYCGKILSNRKNAKYCSNNCRQKAFYHKRNPNAITHNMNKTEEEKRKNYNKWWREYYKNNAVAREKHKQRRRERYKLTGR